MKNTFSGMALFVAALLVLPGPMVSAQDEPGKAPDHEAIDPKTTTRVALGSASGTPDTSVVVPIYFTPAQGVEVGRVKVDIVFVSANMKFGKLERGIAAETGNVELKTDLKAQKNDKGIETSTLTVEGSAPGSAKSGIPAGLLAYVTMKISENGRPAKIALRTAAEATHLDNGQPVKNVRSFDGQVEVFAPGTMPMVNCFFFSH